MTIRKRSGAIALSLAAVVLMGQLPLVAQEPGEPKQVTTPAKKKQDRSHRVPDHFGQIGLTPDQKSSIYGIQAKRFEKIEALEKQILAEKTDMLAECEAVLNDTQKKLLDNLRRNAASPAAKASTQPSPKPSS